MAQMYGQTPTATLKTQPKGAVLGPRYRIVYTVPGPNATRSRVVQLFYPYAKPVPLTYMKPGQSYWGAQDARRLVPQLHRPDARPRSSRAARRALSTAQPMSGCGVGGGSVR